MTTRQRIEEFVKEHLDGQDGDYRVSLRVDRMGSRNPRARASERLADGLEDLVLKVLGATVDDLARKSKG